MPTVGHDRSSGFCGRRETVSNRRFLMTSLPPEAAGNSDLTGEPSLLLRLARPHVSDSICRFPTRHYVDGVFDCCPAWLDVGQKSAR